MKKKQPDNSCWWLGTDRYLMYPSGDVVNQAEKEKRFSAPREQLPQTKVFGPEEGWGYRGRRKNNA